MSIKQELVNFVQENLIGDNGGPQIDENVALIDRGLIDSMGLMQIMNFIEQRTGVRIPDDRVTPDSFQTVAMIDALIQELQAR